MKEYIEREALIKKIFPIGVIDDGRCAIPAKAVKIAIDNAPAADMVEVVRCKDCTWWEARCYGSTVGKCQNPINGLASEYTDDEDYCSYGERKEK